MTPNYSAAPVGGRAGFAFAGTAQVLHAVPLPLKPAMLQR